MKTAEINKAPSIADVARAAGVAQSTVSFVLNNNGRVSETTRQNVLSVVADLHYKPLPGGRPRGVQPPAGRTNRIGLLTAGFSRASLNAPVYSDVLHGAEAAVRAGDKAFMFCHIPFGEPLPLVLFQQKVDGAVLFCAEESELLARRLANIPCVRVMGLPEPASHWDHLSYNNHPIGTLAAQCLLDHGHRHVAVIAHALTRVFNERRGTFQDAVVKAGGTCLDVLEDNLLENTGTVERSCPDAISRLFDRLLAAEPRPTAVFLVADALAPGFYYELQRRGMTLGQDGIEIVSCNNEQSLLANLHPRPTTIDIHAERVGRKAVEQLLWRIEHPDEPRVAMTLDPTLVPGENRG